MANAHENIDNLLVANTLNRILQSSYGNYSEALYSVEDKKGRQKYIHKSEPMLGTNERFQWLDDMVRMSIEQNPQYSDTLATKDYDKTVQGMQDLARPNIFQRFINKIRG